MYDDEGKALKDDILSIDGGFDRTTVIDSVGGEDGILCDVCWWRSWRWAVGSKSF